MTEAELLTLIEQDEGQSLEFKVESERAEDLAEILQGFAHAQGGHLLVGVSDNGTIIGVNNPKTIVDRIHQAANRLEPAIHSYLQIETVQSNGRIVVVAYMPFVPDKLFMHTGRIKTRRGSQTVAMTTEEIKSQLIGNGQITYEDVAVKPATLEDIDSVAFYQYVRKRTRNPEGPGKLENVLKRLNFLVEDRGEYHPTIAALLLFGKSPQNFGDLFNARLRAARFAGSSADKFLDVQELDGPIPSMLEDGLRFFHRNIRHPLIIDPEKTSSFKSITISEYPEAAIREALVNALSHCNYHQKRPIYLKIFDDRIEIENPGGLYQYRELDEVRGHHVPRNRRIADVLHTLGWSERFGTGLIRMERLMKEADLQPPHFHYDENIFVINLFGPGPNKTPKISDSTIQMEYYNAGTNQAASGKYSENWFSDSETAKNENIEAEKPETLSFPALDIANVSGKTGEEIELEKLLKRLDESKARPLRVRQARAIHYMLMHGSITRNHYTTINNVVPNTATDELINLLKLGIIEKIGAGRSVGYRLTNYKTTNL